MEPDFALTKRLSRRRLGIATGKDSLFIWDGGEALDGLAHSIGQYEVGGAFHSRAEACKPPVLACLKSCFRDAQWYSELKQASYPRLTAPACVVLRRMLPVPHSAAAILTRKSVLVTQFLPQAHAFIGSVAAETSYGCSPQLRKAADRY